MKKKIKRKNPKEKKRRFLKLKPEELMIIFLSFLVVAMAVFVSYILTFDFTQQSYFLGDSVNLTKINTSELTEEEQEGVLEIINDVKIIYMKKQRSIEFTKNIEKYGRKIGTRGINKRNGYIILAYTSDDYSLREALCHELLHSYMYRDDISHAIVYDLHGYLPCFKTQ